MNKTFEEMTVKELREESRKRGLTLESKGHKFTKPELIERLTKWDAEHADIDADIPKAIDEAGQTDDNETWGETECTKEVETCADCENTPDVKTKEDDYIVYAKTLEEIEQKYGNRKKQEIYDNELKVGSYVVFVHYVEARNGQIYKKLRTAKVVGINRKKELVRIVTLLGTEKELSFDELLYIKGSAKNCSYPKDIAMYLKEQRTEKGKVLINERFAENNVAD
ncbi:hypothetical protein CS266P2_00061 [Clostridium phage CS266P2]|nr:hypothetical protein CS266P1_00034 [Clostridium phage CS266P1]WAX12189.1 hypothetical protein CS266P2_00061 [Clostridium phage CS266P2]WAX12277.1 hypothetical protein CS266P4_00009 [Clostridium phage CS266P4]